MSQIDTDIDRRDEQTYAIIGVAMEVHVGLGCGFLEAVYQESLAIEFRKLGIPFVQEQLLPVYYKGDLLNTSYGADFICYDSVIVELKALSSLGGPEIAQVLNYLKATGLKKALLLNFGSARLEYRRFVY